jgi:hypothetical protein
MSSTAAAELMNLALYSASYIPGQLSRRCTID